MSTLFEKISLKGLTGELVERVRKERGTASRNTIYRALQDMRHKEEKSPLRNYIVELAEQMLQEQEQSAELSAAA